MPNPTELLHVEPQLFTVALQTSLDFYVEKLGFTVAFVYGEPAFYAQVKRDGAALNLRLVDAPPFTSPRGDRLVASIAVRDAEALYRELEARAVPLARTLQIEPWGARTFVVRDPDENLILFAS